MSQTPYLGSKISLISKLDIRYEGILYTVDSNESTIALAKVRSFGTEDRPTDHPVKARNEVYEYIIFKASDIKDLVVCETPKQPEMGGLDYDPAILSVSKPSEPPGLTEPPIVQPSEETASGPPRDNTRPKREYTQPQQRRPDNRPPPPQRDNRQNTYRNNQQGGYYNNYKPNVNRPFNRTTAPKEKLKFESDYDYVTANEKFQETLDVITDDFANKVVFDADKEELGSEDERSSNASKSDNGCYDKKTSFFDSISCEALEKAEGKNTRPDWRKERQTNQETFGQYAVRNQQYHHRGRNNYNRNVNNPRQMNGPPRYNNRNPGMSNGGYGGNRQQPRENQNRPPPHHQQQQPTQRSN